MASNIGPVREGFSAGRVPAHERFLSSVGALVTLQCALLGERAGAVTALEWPAHARKDASEAHAYAHAYVLFVMATTPFTRVLLLMSFQGEAR